MADPVPASDTVVDDADSEFLYSETSTGNFRKVTVTRFVNSTGLTSANEGEILYIDGDGAYARLEPGDDGDVLTLASAVPAKSSAMRKASSSAWSALRRGSQWVW